MISFPKKRYKLIAVILLVVIVIYFLAQKTKLLGNGGQNEESTTVKKGNLQQELTVSGEIDAREKVALRFQTSGRLAWVAVKEGDYVKKYQGIASLDKRDVQKNLKKKLLAYMNERWDFEQTHDDYSVRGRELYQVPGLTDAERRILDKAQFDLDLSVLDVEIQNLAVEYANLWTPIAGIVTKINTPFPGVNITPAGAEFEIINPDSVFLKATVDQSEVTQINEGLRGELILDSYEDDILKGSINKISFIPEAGETATVYKIDFDFVSDNSAYKYRMGMAGDLTFITNSKENVLYLPTKFIKTDSQDRNYVNIKKDEKTEKIFIKTGLETEDNTEIVSGLKEGNRVYE